MKGILILLNIIKGNALKPRNQYTTRTQQTLYTCPTQLDTIETDGWLCATQKS
jgi:hypothetical protein